MKTKKVNIRSVARAAGTSVASVSRALRSGKSPNLSETQRSHILKVCEELQYYPNEHTRRMLSSRANTIALFFPSLWPFENIFDTHVIDANFGACMMGIQKVLAENSIQLMLSEISEPFLKEKRHLKMIRGKMIDGVIIWGVTNDDRYVKELLNEDIHMVMAQTERDDVSCVKILADDYAGMKSLAKRVFEAGHRKIAIAAPPLTCSAGKERMRGVFDALLDLGMKPAYVTKKGGFGYDYGQNAANEILDNCPEASCIMASNDMAAWGCIDAAKARGLNVPEDISVTGADGLKIPGELQVSSYFSPSRDIGVQSAESLLKLIDGKQISDKICLPTTPVKGNTIGENHD